MAVDVNRGICARRVNAIRPSNIVDERHHNAKVPKLAHQCVHIIRVRKCYVIRTHGILVLGLEQYDWATVGYLCFRDDGCYRFDIVLGGCLIVLIWRPKITGDALQPSRKATSRYFGVDIWARSLPGQ